MRQVSLLPLALGFLAACGSDSSGGGDPVLTYVIEGEFGDTVGARSGPERFLIRVVDEEGRPGLAAVTFSMEAADLSRPAGELTSQLILVPAADGTLPLRIRAGDSIGVKPVVIAATGLVTDTLEFVVRPGNAVGLRVVPADTTVYVGASFVTRTGAVDRLGHLRGEPSPVTVTGAASASGATISGNQLGRAMVVTVGALGTDTGYVSVVPSGTLAALSPLDGGTLVVAALDGSSFQRVKTIPNLSGESSIGRGLAWFPARDELVLVADTVLQGVFRERLYRVMANGTGFQRVRVTSSVHPFSDAFPAFGGDTSQIYFEGTSDFGADHFLWRTTPDGLVAQGFGPASDNNRFNGRPSPAPDGSRIAFVTNNGGTTLAQVAVWDVATQAVLPWQVSGQAPAWSPTGGQIAFVDEAEDRVGVVDADGTGARLLTPAGLPFTIDQLTWSPDGVWIGAVAADGVYLVRASDGLLLRLGDWAQYWRSPALKR